MINVGNSVPGLRSERTYEPRVVLWADGGNTTKAEYLPGGRVIDGSKSRDPLNTGDIVTLRPGVLMGKITSGGKYAPSIIGNSTQAAASAATALTVSAATATELSRRIGSSGNFYLVGPPSSAGTVTQYLASFSAVNTTSGVITTVALTQAFVTDSILQPTDGSQTPLCILDEHIRVTDVDGNSLDCQLSRGLIAGAVDETQIINYPADTSTRTWLRGQLNAPASGCGPFKFKGNF